jgi:hypothetical protein
MNLVHVFYKNVLGAVILAPTVPQVLTDQFVKDCLQVGHDSILIPSDDFLDVDPDPESSTRMISFDGKSYSVKAIYYYHSKECLGL